MLIQVFRMTNSLVSRLLCRASRVVCSSFWQPEAIPADHRELVQRLLLLVGIPEQQRHEVENLHQHDHPGLLVVDVRLQLGPPGLQTQQIALPFALLGLGEPREAFTEHLLHAAVAVVLTLVVVQSVQVDAEEPHWQDDGHRVYCN